MLTRTWETCSTMPSPEATAVSVHVLALDDDPSVRQMIADYLTDNEIRVTAIESGKEIADVMVRHTIDLVIVDLKLKGEDGMQIARNLRAESDIPIIILTGRRDEADRVMGLELVADDYLTKPFSPRELLAPAQVARRRNDSHHQQRVQPARGFSRCAAAGALARAVARVVTTSRRRGLRPLGRRAGRSPASQDRAEGHENGAYSH